MGVHDRDYIRNRPSSYGGGWGLDSLTPAVKYIIFINVAVFLLQIFVMREDRSSWRDKVRRYDPELDRRLQRVEEKGPEAVEADKKKHPELYEPDEDPDFGPRPRISIIQDWFALDTEKVIHGGQVWRLVTHAFCHDRSDIWHILLNMVCLYWFGVTLESIYGTREFALFYVTSAMVAGLTFIGLDLYTGSRIPGIGASGAVMGVMMLYTMHFPRDILYLFFLIRLEMRVVMALYIVWDLYPVLREIFGDRLFTGIAHAAHLGGLSFGFLYYRFQWRISPIPDRIATLLQRWKKPRLRLVASEHPQNAKRELNDIDPILDKIRQSGTASLTDEERAALRAASERAKKRPGKNG